MMRRRNGYMLTQWFYFSTILVIKSHITSFFICFTLFLWDNPIQLKSDIYLNMTHNLLFPNITIQKFSGLVYMPRSLNEMFNRQRVKRPVILSRHWLLNEPLWFHLFIFTNKYGRYIVTIQTIVLYKPSFMHQT